MARIRTIKPEFFTHDRLADLSPLHRLLFVGLWTQSDREGRLEDRPRRLKVEILPYDDCNIDELLEDLSRSGFIIRYELAGERFIAIPGFDKHQNPHIKEAPSRIPPPGQSDGHRASTVPAPDEPGSSREEGKGREGKDQEGKEAAASPPAPVEPGAPPPGTPVQLQEAWNTHAPPLPEWKEWPKKRAADARLRLKERPWSEWEAVVERIAASSFCRGENDRGWRADPDWLLRPGTAAKVLEGKYDDREGKAPRSVRTGRVAAEDSQHIAEEGHRLGPNEF